MKKILLIFFIFQSVLLAEFRVGARSHFALISEQYNLTRGTSSFNPAVLGTGFIHWASKVLRYHYFFIGPYFGSGNIFPGSDFENTSMIRFGADLGFEYRIYKRGLMFTRLMIGQEAYTLKPTTSTAGEIKSTGLNFSIAVGLGIKTRSRIRYWAEFMLFSSNAKITETQESSADIEARKNLLGYGFGAGISFSLF